jgi:hypothetical protein
MGLHEQIIKQINYFPMLKPKAEANNWPACEPLTNHDILREPSLIIVLSFVLCFPLFFSSKQDNSSYFQKIDGNRMLILLFARSYLQVD